MRIARNRRFPAGDALSRSVPLAQGVGAMPERMPPPGVGIELLSNLSGTTRGKLGPIRAAATATGAAAIRAMRLSASGLCPAPIGAAARTAAQHASRSASAALICRTATQAVARYALSSSADVAAVHAVACATSAAPAVPPYSMAQAPAIPWLASSPPTRCSAASARPPAGRVRATGGGYLPAPHSVAPPSNTRPLHHPARRPGCATTSPHRSDRFAAASTLGRKNQPCHRVAPHPASLTTTPSNTHIPPPSRPTFPLSTHTFSFTPNLTHFPPPMVTPTLLVTTTQSPSNVISSLRSVNRPIDVNEHDALVRSQVEVLQPAAKARIGWHCTPTPVPLRSVLESPPSQSIPPHYYRRRATSTHLCAAWWLHHNPMWGAAG